MTQSLYMSVSEASQLLGRTQDWVRNQLNKGNLDGVKIGDRWLVAKTQRALAGTAPRSPDTSPIKPTQRPTP